MSVTESVQKVRKALMRALEWALIVFVAVLTLDVLWGVFSRYILGAQSRWTEELAIYLLIWVSLLGASYTYSEKGHLGVDYFVGMMDPAARRLSAAIVELLVAFFASFALIWGGWVLVTKTLAVEQISPALGWQVGYVYMAAPISGLFFLLFSIENLLEIISGESEPESVI